MLGYNIIQSSIMWTRIWLLIRTRPFFFETEKTVHLRKKVANLLIITYGTTLTAWGTSNLRPNYASFFFLGLVVLGSDPARDPDPEWFVRPGSSPPENTAGWTSPFPWTLLKCWRQLSEREKDFLQTGQPNGLDPVWTILCNRRFFKLWKDLAHSSHT